MVAGADGAGIEGELNLRARNLHEMGDAFDVRFMQRDQRRAAGEAGLAAAQHAQRAGAGEGAGAGLVDGAGAAAGAEAGAAAGAAGISDIAVSPWWCGYEL